MKKTVTINISGIVFTIDEDAYEVLQNYLNTIKSYFNDSDGQQEIMSDIEARIAEMFHEKVNEKNQVININHVNDMMEIMGKPEDFIDDETKAESEQKHYSKTYYTNNKNKRLFRDKDNNVIGGVCSGIGYYFGFDPLWLRLAFAIAFFVFGSGFLFYLLLMIIIPEAKTAAEKLEMKGEPVNIDNIGKTIEEEMEGVKQRFNKFANEARNKQHSEKFKSFFDKAFGFIFNLLQLIFKTFGKIIGGIFMSIGIFLLILIIGMLLSDGESIISWTSEGINTFSFNDWSSVIFGSETNILVVSIGLLLFIGVPAVAIIYGGIKLLFGMKHEVKGIGAIFTFLWIVGVIITIYSGVSLTNNFKAEDEVVDKVVLNELSSDTLKLTLKNDIFDVPKRKRYNIRKNFLMNIDNEKIRLGTPLFTIKQTDEDTVYFEIIKTSKGSNTKEARQMAKAIEYNYSISANSLALDAYYSFNIDNLWRNQELGLVLYIPQGKSIYLSEEMERIIYDIDNVSNTYDPDMVGKTWTMLEPGLTCIGCDPKEL